MKKLILCVALLSGWAYGQITGGGGTQHAAGAPTLNSVLDPSANKTFDLTTYALTWNWGTGNTSTTNLFSVADNATNTGTGYLFTVSSGSSSAVKPFRVCYRGTSNCINMDTTTLTTSGTAVIDATKLSGNLPAISGASLTNVDAATLGGATFAAPGTIGGGTPSVATFTTLNGRNFSATPTTDSVTAVFRRNGAAQTSRLVEFQTEANAFLSGITKAGSFEQTGVTDGCATWASGVLGSTGSACGSGGGTTTNALTANNSGTGDASGMTFNGSAAKTISYNTIGAAPLASPTFTGTPAAPTAAPGTNTTQIATTAFVAAAVTAAGGSAGASTAVQTSNGAGGFTDGGCTASSGAMSCTSYASTGTGGIDFSEEAAPTGAASHTIVWNDSTSHRLKGNANNGGATTYAVFTDNLSVFASTTSAQFLGVISDEVGSGSKVAKFDSVAGNSGVAAQAAATRTTGKQVQFDANGNLEATATDIGGTGSGADANGTYVVATSTNAPTNYQVLTAGSGISITPNAGAHTITVAATGGSSDTSTVLGWKDQYLLQFSDASSGSYRGYGWSNSGSEAPVNSCGGCNPSPNVSTAALPPYWRWKASTGGTKAALVLQGSRFSRQKLGVYNMALKWERNTNLRIYVGLSSSTSSDTLFGSATSCATNSWDCILLRYDTSASDAVWKLITASGGAQTVTTCSSTPPTASFTILQIDLSTAGTITVNELSSAGVKTQLCSITSGNFPATGTGMSMVIGALDTNATAVGTDIAFISVVQNIQ